MYQTELVQIAESLTGLIPRLARGLSTQGNLTPREKDLADELPLAQLRVCAVLSEGPRAMSVLGRELGVSLSALTQIADRLERARLVKRTAARRPPRALPATYSSRHGDDAQAPRSPAPQQPGRARTTFRPERKLVRTAMETLVSACTRVQNGTADDHRRNAAANGNNKAPRRKTTHTVFQQGHLNEDHFHNYRGPRNHGSVRLRVPPLLP